MKLHSIFVLVTPLIQEHLDKSVLKQVQHFGTETIIVDHKPVATGVVRLVQGRIEDFQKLLAGVGDMWTTTSPMFGKWEQHEHIPVKEEVSDKSAFELLEGVPFYAMRCLEAAKRLQLPAQIAYYQKEVDYCITASGRSERKESNILDTRNIIIKMDRISSECLTRRVKTDAEIEEDVRNCKFLD